MPHRLPSARLLVMAFLLFDQRPGTNCTQQRYFPYALQLMPFRIPRRYCTLSPCVFLLLRIPLRYDPPTILYFRQRSRSINASTSIRHHLRACSCPSVPCLLRFTDLAFGRIWVGLCSI